MNDQRLAAKRLPLLPQRVISGGPRNGAVLGSPTQQAGDLFWKCGVECFKPVYARIDARYSFVERAKDEEVREKHAALMEQAKRILQEHRNLIFECVLPLFSVRMRHKGEQDSEADEHAQDYFCRNMFPVMIDTLIATLPSLVLKEDVDSTAQTVRNLADVQTKRLLAQLMNFAFTFRPVLTPQQVEKKRR